MTNSGIQGAYNPLGKYYAKATNNLGNVDFTVTVTEANHPGIPSTVSVVGKTPLSITLAAEPPIEENCIAADGFVIAFSRHGTNDEQESALYSLGKASTLES